MKKLIALTAALLVLALIGVCVAEGWSVGDYLWTVGRERYMVVNCGEYVNARAEADASSISLRRFYLAEAVDVILSWREWSLCTWEESNSRQYGWVKSYYLVSMDEMGYYPQEDYDSGYDGYSGDDDDSDYGDYGELEYYGPMFVVNCDSWVSLRERPDSSSARLSQVPKGTAVEAYYYNSDWFMCSYDGLVGFILSQYLDYGC